MLLSSFPWYHLAGGFFKFHRTFSYPLMHFGKMNHLKVPTPQIHYLISWKSFLLENGRSGDKLKIMQNQFSQKKKKKRERTEGKKGERTKNYPLYLICLNQMKQGKLLALHSQQILWLCWGFRLLRSLILHLKLKKRISQSCNISSSN